MKKRAYPKRITFFLPVLSESFPKKLTNIAATAENIVYKISEIIILLNLSFAIIIRKRYNPKLPNVKTEQTKMRYFRLELIFLFFPINPGFFISLFSFTKNKGIKDIIEINAAINIIDLKTRLNLNNRMMTITIPNTAPEVSII